MIAPLVLALRRTGRLAIQRPGAALWTLAALAGALFAMAVAALAASALDDYAAAHPGSRGAMVVYLGDGVDDAHAAALVSELRGLRGVERAELVPPTEAAHRLNLALGNSAGLLDGVDPAALPASVELTLAPGIADVAALSPTLRALRATPGIADVTVTDSAHDALAAPLHLARAAAWVCAGLFAAVALIIMLSAVRTRLDRSPREAAVLALLGAPPLFTAIPRALAGGLQGGLAALAAATALALAVHGADHSLALTAPPFAALAALVAFGTLVGLAGGSLAGVARGR